MSIVRKHNLGDSIMETRPLGKTGLHLPILSFGASSLGQEFRSVQLDEALQSVRVALDCGLNFIDTSPFYGRGMSEVMLGIALRGVPRESYTLCTKLGRYDLQHFDFSAKRVAESVDVSLHRLGTDHLDIILCHDIEFVPMQQIVDETIPALKKFSSPGKFALSASVDIRKRSFALSASRLMSIVYCPIINTPCRTHDLRQRAYHTSKPRVSA